MDTLFIEIIKSSPILGVMAIMWYFQRKDYRQLVDETMTESKEREIRLQKTIDKNQEIIDELADKFMLVESVKEDVSIIKNYMFGK